MHSQGQYTSLVIVRGRKWLQSIDYFGEIDFKNLRLVDPACCNGVLTANVTWTCDLQVYEFVL